MMDARNMKIGWTPRHYDAAETSGITGWAGKRAHDGSMLLLGRGMSAFPLKQGWIVAMDKPHLAGIYEQRIDFDPGTITAGSQGEGWRAVRRIWRDMARYSGMSEAVSSTAERSQGRWAMAASNSWSEMKREAAKAAIRPVHASSNQ